MIRPIHLYTGLPAEERKWNETEEELPVLEPFLADQTSGGPRGAIIVCPGGGYHHRAYHEGVPVAQWLNSIGIHAFVLHYRVAPHRHPLPLSDALRAIRHVRLHSEEWGIRPDRIGILGFSAGGHLAASAGTLWDEGDVSSQDPVEQVSSRPDAMVLCYPVISFGEFGHKGSLGNLLGEQPTDEQIRNLSLETRVTPRTPPAFLWHTVDDASVPVENSMLMAAALRKAEVSFELHLYPSGRHGLGLAAEHGHVKSWSGLCAAWLTGQGFTDTNQE